MLEDDIEMYPGEPCIVFFSKGKLLFDLHCIQICIQYKMKKKTLTKRLRELGWWKYGEGGSHEKWTNGEQKTVVTRHAEINEYTAEAIVKTAQTSPCKTRKDRT